ncbi:MAG: shikimate kinase [Candidatus Cyclobacteriaceae bacterium M2_1C_046]
MNFFLIGLPGSGKTTLGKRVAEKHGLNFIDLDEEISASESKSIPQIFSGYGENYFRKKETELLINLISKKSDFIMATGGGTPCFFANLKLMKEAGVVLFLNTPLDVIAQRIASEKDKRPLMKEASNMLDKLIELFSSRNEFYQQAQYTVNDEKELDEVVAHLRQK